MTLIICEDKCNDCNVNFVKDPECSGDYYPISSYSKGVVLQRYCPECGKMLPLIEKAPEISTRMKRHIADSCAIRYGRGFKELGSIAKSLKHIKEKSAFIARFATESGLTYAQVVIFSI